MISKEQLAVKLIRKNLDRSIDTVVQNVGCYCNDPGISFTRRRKLPPKVLINFLLSLESGSLSTELLHFFKCKDVPSSSALYQQRMKLDYTAMERVFRLFLSSCRCSKTYKGYRLLAVDGSDVITPYDKTNKETFIKNGCGHNEVHMNALYDILNDKYLDIKINTMTKSGEVETLLQSVEEQRCPDNSIIIADRGYESYELLAGLMRNNQKFIIRCKDINSNGIVGPMNFPDDEFDFDMKVILTRKQTKEVKSNPMLYRILMSKQSFKYLDIAEDYYPMNLRIVRFKLPNDSHETLITNLEKERFSPAEMKELYHLRWCEEVSFRQLKYPLGLVYLRSKNMNLIRQEMYARVILYNFISEIRNVLYISEKTEKYTYKFNFKDSVTAVRMYLAGSVTLRDSIEAIKNSLIPIRPGRSFDRNMTPKSTTTLSYRIA